jgi:penicillin amidase
MSPQNMVYADASGNIAYRTIGTLLNRVSGSGNFPQPATERAANWDGLLKPDLNPAALNPAAGFIASANNRVVRDFPYDMNATFAPRFRYERIAEMLSAGTAIDLQASMQMQIDTHSVLARRMTSMMKQLILPPADPNAQAALLRVTAWDGDVRADLPEPSIYNTWLMRFMYQTFRDELGDELAADYVGERYVILERFLDLLQNQSAFFDDVTTEATETASDIATRAFTETVEILTEYTGSADLQDWQWGQLHRIRFDHLLGKSSFLRPLVNRGPYPLGGDGETNLRAHFREIQPPYTADLAAGFRMIVVFDPQPKGHIVLITGQNEYFLSEHYDDMTALWLQGKYFSIEEGEVRYQTIMQPE